MQETYLRQYFQGKLDIKGLLKDFKNEMTANSLANLSPPADQADHYDVKPKDLIKLCEAFLIGQLNPEDLQAIGFCIIASDNFEYDAETIEGGLVAETLWDWSAPEINHELTFENVQKFKERLETGNDPFL